MTDYITVGVLTLKDLFSGAYRFRLPWFQRAYAWQIDQVDRLLSDLAHAMDGEEGARRYYLGHLMIAKQPDSADTAIVDGHQRTMTLTILFSVLRDLETDGALKSELAGLIGENGFHLSPQEGLADFCRRYVQAPGATAVEPEDDICDLSVTEQNIILNRDRLVHRLEELPVERRRALAGFLTDRCRVVVHAVLNEIEAWRMLQIEEETRLNFGNADRAKFNLISLVSPADRARCSRIWEECERILGPRDLYALLGHVRTLRKRKGSGKPLDEDVAHIFKLNTAGLKFMEEELEPAARRLGAIRKGEVGSGSARASIRQCCERMSWLDDQLWVPAALLWVEKRGDGDEAAAFFRSLDRLVWLMKLSLLGPERQAPRIIALLEEIDRGVPVASMRELAISRDTKAAALACLRGVTFDSRTFAHAVLRRLSVLFGEEARLSDDKAATIEHVLPRSWTNKNAWRGEFATREAVKAHSHRLGNLALLTEAENGAADSKDWTEKRKIYASSTFLLARGLADRDTWTARSIAQRTEELVAILFKDWDLTV